MLIPSLALMSTYCWCKQNFERINDRCATLNEIVNSYVKEANLCWNISLQRHKLFICITLKVLWLISQLTDSTEQSHSWDADSYSAGQEILHLLCDPMVHLHVNNRPPLISILSHMHQVHTFPPNFPKTHSNIIFPSTSSFCKWSLPFRVSNQNIYMYFSSLPQVLHAHISSHLISSHPPRFLPPNNIWWRVHVMNLLIM
jgi:hypothetical protein